ncbi:MAG: RNA polymerase Rpb4 family protein [Thermoplasmata archaeon]
MSSKEGIVPLAEVKAILEEEAGQRELSTEQKYALEHAQRFSRLDDKKAKKLVGDLMEGVEGLSEVLAVKIADIMPVDAEDIRVIFSKERSQPQKKDIEKILGIIEKYR